MRCATFTARRVGAMYRVTARYYAAIYATLRHDAHCCLKDIDYVAAARRVLSV